MAKCPSYIPGKPGIALYQLKRRIEMTTRQWTFTGILSMIAVVWTLLILSFHKWDATWFGISMWIFGIPIVLALFGAFEWMYQYFFSGETTTTICALLLAFTLFSALAGVAFTEPQTNPEYGSGYPQNQSSQNQYDYRYSRAGGLYYYYYPLYFGGSSSSSSSTTTSSSSSSNKGMAYLVLCIGLFVLLIASAVIPHFWVIATLFGLLVWARLTWREMTIERKRGSWVTY
jgi:hypothetical protein